MTLGANPHDEPTLAAARNRRFELLAQGDAKPLHALAEDVLIEVGDGLRLLIPPRVGTLMLRLREPVRGETFNAGEVLVTEAAVAIGAHRGYAMRLGRAQETTLAAAILDAAIEANHPSIPRIEALLAEIASAIVDREAEVWRAVAPTRAVFEEMQ